MSLPVTIENESLCFDVWPMIGGKVSSVVDKADHQELLFTYPAEIPVEHPQYDRPYVDAWHVGWDECFPAVAASRYSGFPYDGTSVPDHGELWGLPTTAVPTKNGITTVWHGLRFGYRLTRKLYLEGASVVAEYTLVNLAPFHFRFVWAQHALLALRAGVEIDAPIKAASLDLRRPDELPARQSWKAYSDEPISGPATIRYPRRGRTLAVEYQSDDGLAAWWGLWMNTGGWGGHKHFALMPTTGRHDRLDMAAHDDTAGRLNASEKRSWSVRWTVGSL